MLLQEFPYLETIISGTAAFLLGCVWYHPKVLGAGWLEARGGAVTDNNSKGYLSAISFVLWMIAACFYSFLILILHLDASPTLFCLSCLLWVAFAMPPTMMGALYTGYPMNAAAIDSAYQLAGYYIFAVVHIGVNLIMQGAHAAPALPG